MHFLQERRRLKERFPSIALAKQDERHCQQMLKSYQKLVIAKHLCEGNCPKGEVCPTGICNLQHRYEYFSLISTMDLDHFIIFAFCRRVLRKNSMYSKSTAEMPSTSKARADSLRRPRSGPAVLLSSKSLPPSRMSSVQSLPDMDMEKGLGFQSAPSSPQKSSLRKSKVCNIAPLVDLDEFVD